MTTQDLSAEITSDIVLSIHIQQGFRAVVIGVNLGSGRPAFPCEIEGYLPVSLFKDKLFDALGIAYANRIHTTKQG